MAIRQGKSPCAARHSETAVGDVHVVSIRRRSVTNEIA
jgi:hypothetical protein